MTYYPLTIYGTRTLIWPKSDPLQQPQRQKNSKQGLWKRYKLYMIILRAYMQVYSILYAIQKMIWMSMFPL